MSSRWKFWVITVVAWLALAVTLALGRWQLARAAQKEAVLARIQTQAALPPLDSPTLAAQVVPASALHRRASLRGRWLAQHTVFLDNRPMNGKAGFYVVTPLVLPDRAGVVLVQRGWVARNFVDRSRVPPVATPTGEVDIEGHLVPPPAKLYELGGPPEAGLVRQNLDLARFSTELGLSLLPLSVQQTGAASDGLLREWPLVGAGVDKHYGYAFQWFGLSGLIAILYVWFQIVRRFLPPRRA